MSKIKSSDKIDRPITIEDILVETIKSGGHYELDEILYETDSYTLKNESKFTLRCFADYLNKNKTYAIKIEGHTDDIGDRQKNLILSQNRAATVKEYLIEQGIEAERLDSKGFGESRPKVPNNSSENRRKNRRTEFELTIE
jgi:outer membrane protein OmpA-like peptidoglycan-associated protein